MNAKRVFRLGLIVSTSLFLTPCALARDQHMDPHWTYEEQKKWGMLVDPIYSPRFPYAECGIGQKQSPLNINMRNVVSTDDIDELAPQYLDNPLSLTNNGHTIRVNTGGGSLYIGKNLYELVQFHFHAPSEHHLNGAGYPLEVHFVNGTQDGRLAVIGVFIQAGEFNEEFQKILSAAPHRAGTTVNTSVLISPNLFLPKSTQHFYTYAWSLTTPPCTEGIQWYVLSEPIEVSGSQIEEFREKFYRGNARIEQKLNGRKIISH